MANPNPELHPENLKPFEKNDKRINKKGQIKKPDQFKALILKLANEQAVKLKAASDGELEATPVTIDGVPVTNIEMILRKWMNSDKNALNFIEYAYGKIPQAVALTGSFHEIDYSIFDIDELTRITSGESEMVVYADALKRITTSQGKSNPGIKAQD